MEEQNKSNEKKGSISLLDLLHLFFKYKNKILVITGISMVIAAILYFFVFDLIYYSFATLKSDPKSSSIIGAGIEIPDIGELGDLDMTGGKSGKQLAMYEKILTSRKCIEPLIIKFGLMERDEHRFMEDAIKEFAENKLEIKNDKQSGLLTVGVFDKDPILAKDMVEYLLEQLDKINIELNIQSAKNNREFIESRYFSIKEDLKKAEDSLKSFQLVYGIAPDLQIKASAQSVFSLEAELKAEEVKLDVLKKILSSDQPEVKTQEAKVNSLRSKITEINTSTDLDEFLRLGNSPQVAMNFLRLQREVEIQTKILVFMVPLYEQAKIEEKKETPTVLILDKPVVAEKKKKPKRLTMVIVITFVSFLLSVGFFAVYDKGKLIWVRFKDIEKKSRE